MWRLFGGREQYRSAPALKVHKHILRWQIEREVAAERQRKEDEKWAEVTAKMGGSDD